jgi:hypothetical protein
MWWTPEAKAEVFRSLGLEVFPWQATEHSRTERFLIWDCGRRAGKSKAGGREAFLQCMVPESYVWIVAPTMDLAEKEFRVVWDLAVRRKMIPVTGKSKREHWIEFENGSFIECRTEENPDQLIGEGVDLMIVAEAARLKPLTWEELLRPTLSDKPGRAVFSSTPRGRNFFYRLWTYGQSARAATDAGEDPDEWHSVQVPSSANPLILRSDVERVERLIAADPVAHVTERQEWMADFVSYKGVVFPEFMRDVHVRREHYEVGQKTMLWVDPGITNPYACLLVQVTGDETIRVIGEVYRTGKTTDEIIAEAQRAWPYAMFDGGKPGNGPSAELEVVVDEAAAEAIASWRIKGYRAWGAKPPLRTGIDVYHRMLRDPFRHADVSTANPLGIWPRITFDPSCVHAIEEHNLYHYPDEIRRRSEDGPTEVPVDADNHAISAIRYGLYAVYPELFNEYHPQTQMVYATAEELGLDVAMERMRIDSGLDPREGFSLGDY